MTTLTRFASRPYAGEADLQAVCDLLNACDAVDHFDDNYDVDSLRVELSHPRFADRNLRLWHDAGQAVGWGQIWLPQELAGPELDGHINISVLPAARGNGLEEEILHWGEERVREAGRERGVPAIARSGMDTRDTGRQALLEAQGYTIARYFFKMARPLDQPIPDPQFPPGYTLRHVADEADVERWVDTYNWSFIDHYNHHPLALEDHKHWLTDANYLPERDLVAETPDGTFAAFCFCWINPADNARNQRREGWIDMLGTRRGHRNIGLGRAMLLTGLQRLKAEGMDTAVLGVDAQNPTGALGLYERVGFTKVQTWVTYGKNL